MTACAGRLSTISSNRHRRLSTRRGLLLEWIKKMDEPAVPMDERLTAFLADAIEAAGFPAKRCPAAPATTP